MTRRRAERIAWIIGGIGLAGASASTILAPVAFPHAWLAALTTWLGWPLGCMGLLLVHALTGGQWGHATRPQLVAGMTSLVLLPPALIPLIMVLPALYPWLRPEVAAHLSNGFYLNLPFLTMRTVAYLIVWFGLGVLILNALRRSDANARLARIAPFGLILLAVSITFAAIDATMSLDPHFTSSVYGLITIVDMGLLALAVSIFAAIIQQAADSGTMRDFGRMLLALVILWAYLDFVQMLIVWQADLPDEAAWYIPRIRGGWGIMAGLIATGHFLLPFFVLLSPALQRSRLWIAFITALLIVIEIIRGWWLVLPAAGRGFGPVDVLAMLAVLGIGTALALRAPLLPFYSVTEARRV
ncbi:MAG TPA: hypothetical protein VLZ74_14835 [Methylocella sp.]|nr:hypothetical protein [Methylocella sp.]